MAVLNVKMDDVLDSFTFKDFGVSELSWFRTSENIPRMATISRLTDIKR